MNGTRHIAWSCVQADVAQARVPAVSRLVSTPVRRRGTVSQRGVGRSADAAGTSACATSLACLLLGASCAFAQFRALPNAPAGALPAGAIPPQLEGVGVEERLGRNIDLNLTFEDENGSMVNLQDFFHRGKPVVLDLVYYRCPMLCNLVLNGQTEVMRDLPWTPGNEYEIVTISIDPHESRDLAREKKAQHLAAYGRPAPGWHFLVDYAGNAQRLADQVGFHYRYDARQDQYAHPAAIMILSPEGKMSRYLYGVRYKSRDVRFALAEASGNRTTMAYEKVLLFCYHYDPQANSYTLFAMNLMRGGGIVTVLLLGLYLLRAHRNSARNGHRGKPAEGLV